MTRFSRLGISKQDILSTVPMEKTDYDKLSVVFICLNDEASEHGDKMIHLLNTLFSGKNSAEKIEAVLENEYGIPKSYEFGEEVRAMCNLSERIEQRGIEQGIEQGIQQGIERGIERGIAQGIEQGIRQSVIAALKKLSAKDVSEILGIPLKDVLEIQKTM